MNYRTLFIVKTNNFEIMLYFGIKLNLKFKNVNNKKLPVVGEHSNHRVTHRVRNMPLAAFPF